MVSKIGRLEALRGLTAIYVVIHHTVSSDLKLYGLPIGQLTRFGQEAVILFFLLSGFVINLSCRLSTDQSFKSYFYKRFFRIYTPLVAVYLVSYLNSSYNAGEWLNPALGTLLLNVLMLQDWETAKPHVIVSAYMGNDPLWSLSYEWWFYMLYFPLFTFVKTQTHRDWIVYGTGMFSAALYLYYPAFALRIFMYLVIWWMGVKLADSYLDGTLNQIRRHLLPALAISTIIVLSAIGVYVQYDAEQPFSPVQYPFLELRHFCFALLAYGVALGLHRFGWRWFDVLVSPFMILAPISYVVYIIHWPLATQGQYLEFIDNPLLRWCAYVAVVLTVAFVIERMMYPPIRRKLWTWVNK
ncbi:MAG: acyltransferase family protein [Granulosicoccus sp.]